MDSVNRKEQGSRGNEYIKLKRKRRKTKRRKSKGGKSKGGKVKEEM